MALKNGGETLAASTAEGDYYASEKNNGKQKWLAAGPADIHPARRRAKNSSIDPF